MRRSCPGEISYAHCPGEAAQAKLVSRGKGTAQAKLAWKRYCVTRPIAHTFSALHFWILCADAVALVALVALAAAAVVAGECFYASNFAIKS